MLLFVTWIVDILWMVYWIPVWFSDEMKDWQKGVHSFVAFFSVINFLLKVTQSLTVDRCYDNARTFLEGQHRCESGRKSKPNLSLSFNNLTVPVCGASTVPKSR